jgi:hypothetical protein
MLDKQTCFIRSSTKSTGSRGSGRRGIGYVRPPGSSTLASFAYCRQTFGFRRGLWCGLILFSPKVIVEVADLADFASAVQASAELCHFEVSNIRGGW